MIGLSRRDVWRVPAGVACLRPSSFRAIPTLSAGRSIRFEANADLTLFYADASALVKLVRDEPESEPLRNFIMGSDLVSCDLVLAELPRAVRRAAAADPGLPLELLMRRATELLEALGLLPLDRDLLTTAGALAEPALRALDAIHVSAAIALLPLDGFVSYDERQAAAARLAGLRTVGPRG